MKVEQAWQKLLQEESPRVAAHLSHAKMVVESEDSIVLDLATPQAAIFRDTIVKFLPQVRQSLNALCGRDINVKVRSRS